MSLRSPVPFTFAGFAEFNRQYSEVLKQWNVFVDGVNPVARTNIAPLQQAPAVPSLYGFSFTRPTAAKHESFVVAGAGELPEGKLSRDEIVSLGDVSPNGLRAKATFVMDLMENRLKLLGAEWRQATTINVYTPHSITPLLPDVIQARIGAAAIHGVRWHYSRPPVEDIEYEMDVRGVWTELTLGRS